MKAITPAENADTNQRPATKASMAHFVIFAILFGAWLTIQVVK